METLSLGERVTLLLRRLAALAYDLLLSLALCIVAAIPWVLMVGEATQPGDWGLRLWLASVCAAYVVAAWVRQGATLGMLAWGLRLQTHSRQALSLRRALVRLALAVFGSAAMGLTWWWCLFDGQGRALHDRLTATTVRYRPR